MGGKLSKKKNQADIDNNYSQQTASSVIELEQLSPTIKYRSAFFLLSIFSNALVLSV